MMTDGEKNPARLRWDAVIVLCFAASAGVALCGGVSQLAEWTCLDFHEQPAEELSHLIRLGVLMLACTGAACVRLAVLWTGGAARGWALAARGGVIVLMVAGMYCVVECRPGYDYGRLAERFEAAMRAEADVKAIRAWAPWAAWAEGEEASTVPEALWPPGVKALRPRWVELDRERGTVTLRWGGRFPGQYGLVVGPEGMEAPGARGSEKIVPLGRGAYLFLRLGGEFTS